MRLIVETINNVNTQIVLDESTGNKTTYIHGIFAQAESLNRNKRVYPKSILENAVNVYIDNYVNQNRAIGEMEHPNYPNPNIDKAAILIENLEWDGDNVIGKAKVLSTDKGKNLAALIADGVSLGISTRGLGSVTSGKFKNEAANIVNDDYEIRAFDIVSNPSGIDCFVDGILEGVEYYYQNGILLEREIENIQENVRKNDIDAIKKDFSLFMNRILY